jgi:hypothetical protein
LNAGNSPHLEGTSSPKILPALSQYFVLVDQNRSLPVAENRMNDVDWRKIVAKDKINEYFNPSDHSEGTLKHASTSAKGVMY